jgi:hypothetical protein
MVSGVFPTASFIAAYNTAAGCISTSFCAGNAIASIDVILNQSSDIMQDGSNAPGQACDGISFGLAFTASSAFNGTFPTVKNCCADAGP